MSIKAVRAARRAKGKKLPIEGNPQTDVSGVRGTAYRTGSVLRDRYFPDHVSGMRPFMTTEGKYPNTPPPSPAEYSDRPEGPSRMGDMMHDSED